MNAGMSVMGQKRPKYQPGIMSAIGGKADEIIEKADIEPAGLRFSRLFTDSHNGCMGWSEIASDRFAGPVDKLRKRLEPKTSVFSWLNQAKSGNKRDNSLIFSTDSQAPQKTKPT